MLEPPRRFAIAVVLGVASALALHAQSGSAPKPAADNIRIPFETYAPPNGLRVILAPDATTPTVAVNVASVLLAGDRQHGGSLGGFRPGRQGFFRLSYAPRSSSTTGPGNGTDFAT